jgi:MbtH protein
MTNEIDQMKYFVVINDEEQYSIWLASRDIPPGWRNIGDARSKAECLEEIEKVWTDMRPRSLREAMLTKTRQEHVASD